MSDANADAADARRFETVDGGSQNLGIAFGAGDADKLRARLLKLAKPRAFAVSEHGAGVAVAFRAAVRAVVLDAPSDDGRREFRAQTHADAARVGEGVEAAGDFAAGFADEQIGALQRGRVESLETARRQNAPDAALDAVSVDHVIGREIAHTA